MLDVKNGLGADMNFRLGQPFRPFQQLMGVLPDRSKKIVPTPYHDLMTNPESPIIDFYPRDFELDMNGKKMEWEAVVKIPFIEEKRLLSAMATKENALTDAERARNDFGVSLKFTYDPNVDYIYPSSMPGIFPDLDNCRCVENIFELPTMDGLEVYIGLVDGVQLGVSALAGFPSLKVLPFSGQLGFHGVNVFQQDSRNESMVVTLHDNDQKTKVAKAVEKLGKAIHIGYPFLQEAKIVKVSDELFDYTLPGQGNAPAIQLPHQPHEISAWKRKADRIESVYSKRLGMIIGSVESLVHVELLKGLKKTDDGATIKEYANLPGQETDYATQTIVDEVVSVDHRFLEKSAIPFAEDYPEGSRAFFLGDYAYGRPLEVISHHGNKAEVWVLTATQKEKEFGREIAAQAERTAPYIPSYGVARKLNLNPLVLSRLTSSFSVNSSSLKLNLGLNLKFEAKKMKVLGYSRKGQNGWEYSQKAVELIQQYMIKFPEFIAGVMRNPKGDIYEDTDFYPPEIAKTKMKEIGAWLKSIESKSFEKVPLEAEQFDSDVVKLIEAAADVQIKNTVQGKPQKMKGVPRNALLKPSDAEQRVSNQHFTLGDRVVYVQDSGRVPIGQRGTVVGVTRTSRATLLDVVFDTTFMSGSSLGERCSPFRGSTVPSTSVLNLTNKQVITWSRESAAKRPTVQQSPLTVRGYGVPTGPGGQGQLTPATAPPPLRGSFRGALSGQWNGNPSQGSGSGRGVPAQNGQTWQQQQLPFRPAQQHQSSNNAPGRGQYNGTFRGRGQSNENSHRGRGAFNGNSNKQGYVPTDLSDPNAGVIENNPGFQPRNYSHVPPPNQLDGGNRRGRGRGNSRGGSRGRGAPRGRSTANVTQ